MRNENRTLMQWESAVSDAFHIIRVMRCNWIKANDILQKRVHEELNSRTKTRARYPAFIKGYVHGLIAAENTKLYRDHLEFRYLVNGVLYTASKTGTGQPKTEVFYARDEGHILSRAPNGHYWIGTDKPYFTDAEKKEG